MHEYLAPADVCAARLACRHWRSSLSAYTPALTLPTRLLGAKGARVMLTRAGAVFPSAGAVTLLHTGAWCDPVQVRRHAASRQCQHAGGPPCSYRARRPTRLAC